MYTHIQTIIYHNQKRPLNPAYLPQKNGLSFKENKQLHELHLLDGKFIYHNQKMAYPIIHDILDGAPAYQGNF